MCPTKLFFWAAARQPRQLIKPLRPPPRLRRGGWLGRWVAVGGSVGVQKKF